MVHNAKPRVTPGVLPTVNPYSGRDTRLSRKNLQREGEVVGVTDMTPQLKTNKSTMPWYIKDRSSVPFSKYLL